MRAEHENEVGFLGMAIWLGAFFSLFTPLLIALIAVVGTHLAKPDYSACELIAGPMITLGLLVGYPVITWGIHRNLPEDWADGTRAIVAFAAAIPVTLIETGLGFYLFMLATIRFWV